MRKKGRGGGLAVVYKSQLTVQTLQPLPTVSMEIDLTSASQKCLSVSHAFLEVLADIVDSYRVTKASHHPGWFQCPHEFWHQCWCGSTADGGEGRWSGAACPRACTHQGHTLDLMITRDNDPLVESVTTDHSHLCDHMAVVCYLALETTAHFQRHAIPCAEQDRLWGLQAPHPGAGADIGSGVSGSQSTALSLYCDGCAGQTGAPTVQACACSTEVRLV